MTGTGRLDSEPLTWSYASMALPLIQHADFMLDMGTGGGEFISKVRPFPKVVFATEAYKPNVPIARKRLEPLGVKVFEVEEDESLPLETNYFDLVLNKHEAYSNQEVRRIMSTNAIFLTQQVGGHDCHEINQALGLPINEEFYDWNLERAKMELLEHGFDILQCREEYPNQRFYDIGALVYYLKAIPWQVPDFNMEKNITNLYKIHELIQEKGYFDVKQHRFFIKAKAI